MNEFVIDKVIFSEKHNRVVLSLTQPDPWDGPHVLSTLKGRLGEYLFAVESGYIEKEFPSMAGKPAMVRIVHYFPIPEDMLPTMALIQEALHKKSIGFELLQIKVSY